MVECILCGGNTRDVINERTKEWYHRCESCDLFFKNRSMILSHDLEKKRYLLHNNSINDDGYYLFLSRFLNQYLYPFIGKTSLGLDFGSGPNAVLCEIVKKEFSIEMKHYDPFFHNDISSLELKYDFITSTEVFEHFDDVKNSIEQVVGLLKPGGVLAIMTLLHADLDEDILKSHYIRDETHISIFGKQTIQYLCEKYHLLLVASDCNRNFTFKKANI